MSDNSPISVRATVEHYLGIDFFKKKCQLNWVPILRLHPADFLIPLLIPFSIRGVLSSGSLGLALFLMTTVSPIASDVNWWSSETIWGGTIASCHGRLQGGTLGPTDLVADDVLTRVKLLPGKLATIWFTLPVWIAAATQ